MYTYINTYKDPIILIYLCYVRAITSPQLFSNTLTFDCNGKFVAMSRPATWKMQHVFSSTYLPRVMQFKKHAQGHRPQGLQRGLIYVHFSRAQLNFEKRVYYENNFKLFKLSRQTSIHIWIHTYVCLTLSLLFCFLFTAHFVNTTEIKLRSKNCLKLRAHSPKNFLLREWKRAGQQNM